MSGRAAGAARARVIVALALAAATLLLYLPVRDFGFIPYDDPGYVQDNWVVREGCSRESVAAAFRSFQQGFWIPMTWLSFQADTEFHGPGPSGYHLTNALLHALNVLLLVLFLEACTGMLWPAAAAAALLAFHPLHVESVAWITERKDVLALFFGLLCLLQYVKFVRRPSPVRYLAVAGLLAAALASKPMMMTVPLLMLILDWWPLQRPGALRLPSVTEKLPLLALAAGMAVLTYLAHRGIGSLTGLDQIPLPERLGNALAYIDFYLSKAVWPARLGMFYYDPGETVGKLQMLTAAVVIAGVTALAVHFRRRWPAGIAGWAWFGVGLLPVIGFVRPGDQMVADRFTYLPLIGLSVALAWGLRAVTRSRRAATATVTALFLLVVVCLARATSTQLSYWNNGVLLFKHSVAVSPRSQFARVYLANSLAAQGNPEAAETEFRNLLAGSPQSFFGWRDYGVLLHGRGRYPEALAAFDRARQLNPRDGEVVLYQGMTLFESGDREGAEARFREALAMSPDDPDRLANLGTLLAETGREEEAERLLVKALAVDAHHPLASRNLAVLRAKRAVSQP